MLFYCDYIIFNISPEMDPSIIMSCTHEIASQTFDVVAENQIIYVRVNKAYHTNFEPRMKEKFLNYIQRGRNLNIRTI